jgi:hypothetical protein
MKPILLKALSMGACMRATMLRAASMLRTLSKTVTAAWKLFRRYKKEEYQAAACCWEEPEEPEEHEAATTSA